MARPSTGRSPGVGRPGPEIHDHTMTNHTRYVLAIIAMLVSGALMWLALNTIPAWQALIGIIVVMAIAGTAYRKVGQSNPPDGSYPSQSQSGREGQ